MRDQIKFPVVGTYYRTKEEQTKARTAKPGVPAELRATPTDEFPNAVGVFIDDVQVGFVPDNKNAVCCSACWSSIKPNDVCCPGCGSADHYQLGGLATRLKGSGVLDKEYACMVEEVDPYSSYETLKVLLVVV